MRKQSIGSAAVTRVADCACSEVWAMAAVSRFSHFLRCAHPPASPITECRLIGGTRYGYPPCTHPVTEPARTSRTCAGFSLCCRSSVTVARQYVPVRATPRRAALRLGLLRHHCVRPVRDGIVCLFLGKAVSLLALCREGRLWPEGRGRAREGWLPGITRLGGKMMFSSSRWSTRHPAQPANAHQCCACACFASAEN